MWRAGALTIVMVFGACDGAEAVPSAPAVVQTPIQSPIQAPIQDAILPKTATVSEIPRFRYADLSIETSLEATCVEATGVELGQKLAQVAKRVLVWWVDVHRQLHKGDRIEAVYEVPEDPSLEPIVHAIWFHSRQHGRTLSAVRHRIEGDNFARWYDQNGAEIERRLIGGPIEGYEQITSLVGDGRGHRGVDFKAPIGTPVVSPFNGWVKRKNWARRRNGNCLEIVDAKTGLSAYFLHLDSFAKGMRPGTRVKKGQLLARSGNTGRSSAPHLHYQLERADGRAVDPFRVHRMERRKLPREKVVEVQQALQRFGTYRTGSS
jgi:murein DD-endopeptidase MepM/ murein hydrolase activator NlpD